VDSRAPDRLHERDRLTVRASAESARHANADAAVNGVDLLDLILKTGARLEGTKPRARRGRMYPGTKSPST